MKCPYCNYEWIPRKPMPVSCPRCKRRFDYPSATSDPLKKAKKMERGFQRNIYVMAVLTKRLEKKGIKPVIIGGAAVEFYTRDWYATGDIDLAIDKRKRKVFDEVVKKAGFIKHGRMWVREDLNLYIETPADIGDINMEKITVVETDEGNAYLIGLEDIIFDRVQAAKHWESEADKEQAIRIASLFYEDIDWDYIRKNCEKAGSEKMLDVVMKETKNEKDKLSEMD